MGWEGVAGVFGNPGWVGRWVGSRSGAGARLVGTGVEAAKGRGSVTRVVGSNTGSTCLESQGL